LAPNISAAAMTIARKPGLNLRKRSLVPTAMISFTVF
jgi:hypothetical protein